jgi:hypothetical protein
MLEMIGRVLARWRDNTDLFVIGGDFNASLEEGTSTTPCYMIGVGGRLFWERSRPTPPGKA